MNVNRSTAHRHGSSEICGKFRLIHGRGTRVWCDVPSELSVMTNQLVVCLFFLGLTALTDRAAYVSHIDVVVTAECGSAAWTLISCLVQFSYFCRYLVQVLSWATVDTRCPP